MLLVYAYRDWSFQHVSPALEGINYVRWCREKGKIDFSKFKMILTAEPTIEGWRETWKEVEGKIPVLAMQQSVTYTSITNPNATWSCDKIIAWGDKYKEFFIRHKVNEEDIFVTGNPYFDRLYNEKIEDDGYILILSQMEKLSANRYKHLVKGLVANGKKVVIKLHPNDKKIVNIPEVKILNTGDTIDLMRKASVVVTGDSGCGIQSLILGKPTVFLRTPNNTYLDTKLVFDENQLLDKVLNAKDLKCNPNFVQNLSKGPGATAKVHMLIKYLMGDITVGV